MKRMRQDIRSTQFADALLAAPPASSSGVADQLRRQARDKLADLDLPGPKDEAWRFIRLRGLTDTDFVPADQVEASVSKAMIADYELPEAAGRQLVFVNGRFSADLSDASGLDGRIQVGHLADDDGLPASVEDRLGQIATYYGDDYFLNLNSAGFTDGAFVVVPGGAHIDEPVHLLHVSTESSQPYAVHPRTVVVVEQASKLTLVEEYVGPQGGQYFNNVVNEVAVAEQATLQHTRVQRDGAASYHMARTAIDLQRGATYNSQTVSLGAKLSRYDVYANGDAEQIDCTLDGLAVLSDSQVSDTHTVMDHRQPHAGSHQLHKMVLDDRAHAVFNGKIFVQPDAQMIDAYQLNRTLLLSDAAKVNTKPQLEIFADDVQCTHGATVGQLEDDQLFYLRARGLSKEEARDLLVYAFAAEIIETIPVESLVDQLAETVSRRTSRR